MNRRLSQFALAAGIATASMLAVPAAASASTIYPPTGACSVSPTTTAPGGTVSFSCVAGTFSPSESVTVTVTGENGAAVGFGMVEFAVTTGSATRTSTATGALPTVSVTLPSNASGVYNIAALSPTSAGGQASVTVTSSSGGSSNLPATGTDSSQLLGLWVGGGALLLAGGAIAVAATVRRTHRSRS